MYLVDRLEKCSFGSVIRSNTPPSISPCAPRPIRPSDHQNQDNLWRNETSQTTRDFQASEARTAFEAERGVWRWVWGHLWGRCNNSTDLGSVRFEGAFGCVALCSPQESGNAAVRLPKNARNYVGNHMIPITEESC